MEYMRGRGVYCTATGVPGEAHIGCGIAAKFNCGQHELAKNIVMENGLDTFFAFYHIEKNGLRTSTRRI